MDDYGEGFRDGMLRAALLVERWAREYADSAAVGESAAEHVVLSAGIAADFLRELVKDTEDRRRNDNDLDRA